MELHKDDFAVKVLNKLINNGGIMMSSFSLAKQGFVKRDMNQKMNDVDIIIPESNDDFRENPLKWMENIFGKGNVKLLNDFKDSEDSPYTNKFFLVGEDSILFSEMKENGFLRGATVSIKDGKEWIKVDTAQFDIGKQPVLFDKNTISAESTLEAKRLLAKRGEQKHIDDIKNWKWFEQQKQQAIFMFSEFLDLYLQDFEQVERILKEEKIIDKDCTDSDKLKAEKGLQTNFIKGGKWRVIKDLKGYPTHKEGGVDLTISKDGVSIKNGNTQFIAKHGLVIPKN